MTKPKVPRELDAIADTVLAYRPKARSKPAIQRKRRRMILEKRRRKETCLKNGNWIQATQATSRV